MPADAAHLHHEAMRSAVGGGTQIVLSVFIFFFLVEALIFVISFNFNEPVELIKSCSFFVFFFFLSCSLVLGCLVLHITKDIHFPLIHFLFSLLTFAA